MSASALLLVQDLPAGGSSGAAPPGVQSSLPPSASTHQDWQTAPTAHLLYELAVDALAGAHVVAREQQARPIGRSVIAGHADCIVQPCIESTPAATRGVQAASVLRKTWQGLGSAGALCNHTHHPRL